MFRPLHLVPTTVTWSIPRCAQLNALTQPLREGRTPSGRSLVPYDRPGSEKRPRRPGPALSVSQASSLEASRTFLIFSTTPRPAAGLVANLGATRPLSWG